MRDETAGRYKTKALLIVAGIREDGYREILGLKLAENEGEDFWLELSEALKNHGLRRVKLVVSDGHKGIRAAVEKAFLGASWQMCHVRFVRDVLRKVPKKEMEGDIPYQSFPEKQWRRIKTTNILERVNKELKRCSGVVGAFPNERSLIRLAVAIPIDINEERLTGRRYLDMEESGL